MKTLTFSFLFIALASLAGDVFTTATNYPSVTLTVTAPNILKADGIVATPTMSPADFIVTNGFVMLAPSVARSISLFSVPSNSWPASPGAMNYDTNYLYIAVQTNLWRRVSLPTNTW